MAKKNLSRGGLDPKFSSEKNIKKKSWVVKFPIAHAEKKTKKNKVPTKIILVAETRAMYGGT